MVNAGDDYISFIHFKLAWPVLPTMMWSCTPSGVAICTIALVISMSACEGVGSPLGWLCTVLCVYLSRSRNDDFFNVRSKGDLDRGLQAVTNCDHHLTSMILITCGRERNLASAPTADILRSPGGVRDRPLPDSCGAF